MADKAPGERNCGEVGARRAGQHTSAHVGAALIYGAREGAVRWTRRGRPWGSEPSSRQPRCIALVDWGCRAAREALGTRCRGRTAAPWVSHLPHCPGATPAYRHSGADGSVLCMGSELRPLRCDHFDISPPRVEIYSPNSTAFHCGTALPCGSMLGPNHRPWLGGLAQGSGESSDRAQARPHRQKGAQSPREGVGAAICTAQVVFSVLCS